MSRRPMTLTALGLASAWRQKSKAFSNVLAVFTPRMSAGGCNIPKVLSTASRTAMPIVVRFLDDHPQRLVSLREREIEVEK